MNIPLQYRAGLLACTLFALALPAQAQTDLGTINGPTVIHISGELTTRPSTDYFTFRIGSENIDLSSVVFTPSNPNGPWLDNLSTMMFDQWGSVPPGSFGEPERVPGGLKVTMAPLELFANRYYNFRVWAPATDANDTLVSWRYEGTLTFGSVAAPVPEPGSLAMLFAGLGLVGGVVRRAARR